MGGAGQLVFTDYCLFQLHAFSPMGCKTFASIENRFLKPCENVQYKQDRDSE